MLQIAGVGLNAAEDDAVGRDCRAHERRERCLVGAAGAAVAGGEIDENIERLARPARDARQRREVVGMIDDDDARERYQRARHRLGRLLDLDPQEAEALELRGSLRAPGDALPTSQELVLVALRHIDLPVERVLLLGDTPYDLESASRAGVTHSESLTS